MSLLLASAGGASAAGLTSRFVALPESVRVAPFVSVSLVSDGIGANLQTQARTVEEFLREHGVEAAPDDYLSAPLDAQIVDGMEIVVRRAVTVTLDFHGERRTVRSAGATIAELLNDQNIKLTTNDEISPEVESAPQDHTTVRVKRVRTWVTSLRESVAAATERKPDAELGKGLSRTLQRGRAGVRSVTFRYVQREDAPPERTELASSVLRAPRPRIVGAGIATYDALAGYAKRGFESALRIAGAALHMIATAYTANCYECSGITKLGLRAGHGIVAVDPRIIPLGSKIFVPGYGRAVAGDTGGAIVGHRIDLGFDSDHAAIEFGRRAVTVYLLR